MLMRVGRVDVELKSRSESVCEGWRHHFGSLPPRVISGAAAAHVSLSLALCDKLSMPASVRQVYQDRNEILDVYTSVEDTFLLHFRQGAVVRLSSDEVDAAQGEVTPPIFRHGQLEDVTYTSLAPLLRRHACYLLHAAAVTTAAGAVLLVGPSHSGKTTTGLALILGGYKHLASDVVALTVNEGRISAFPTAGVPRVRARSFELLPALRTYLAADEHERSDPGGRSITIPAERWDGAAPLVAICFPQVTDHAHTTLEELAPSVALARLMEESIDRWDSGTLLQHIDFLTKLSEQARHFTLNLAPDVHQLPQLIESSL